MKDGYGQFCPIAKATEIFATRWTPLVLRELMSGVCTFNDIHRGVPLMSRALLAERLRQLEREGIVEKRVDGTGAHPEYRLTAAGVAFREVIGGLAQWGLQHARDRLEAHDLDPGLYMWKLRTHIDKQILPSKRVLLRFEFTGVPKSRTSLRLMWLVLDRTAIEVCIKDPGYPVDLTIRGDIAALVAIFLRHAKWGDKIGKSISLDGSRTIAR
ncbi:MAG TPA: helix-turn-helix domain-containing protein, partial [Rhizomicrobium sp.]|nr:helix-turn-helix domain-containing protein [Rhizomicrobium sp.]